MYKVVISDDERIIRERLERFVTKNIAGLEVVKSFEDGQDVIDYLGGHHVDIVITDIRMIKVSGIDVAKYVFENKLPTKVIILSGYREFEYAKNAIKYNVRDYLLKPTDIDAFTDVLNKTKNELDQEHSQRYEYDELMPFMKEQFFINIVMGALCTKEDIDRKLNTIKLVDDPLRTMAALIRIKLYDYNDFLENKWDYGRDELNKLISDSVKKSDLFGSVYEILFRDSTMQLLYVSDFFESKEEFGAHTAELTDGIIQEISNNVGIDVRCDKTTIYKSIYELAEESGSAISVDRSKDGDGLDIERIRLLVTYIHSGCYEEALNMYDKYIASLEGMSGEQISRNVYKLFETVYNMIEGSGFRINYVKRGKLDYSGVLNLRHYEEIRRYGRELVYELTMYIDQFEVGSSDMIIRKAKKFIDDNYQLDISLQDVADHVFLSQKYFSKFFKNKTGENFIDYLVKVRMECAIKLLGAGYTIEQISRKTGYKSSRYFTRRFKQYTGFTPKEYARRMMNGNMPD